MIADYLVCVGAGSITAWLFGLVWWLKHWTSSKPKQPCDPSAAEIAWKLVRQTLTAEQWSQLQTMGFFEIPSRLTAGKVYQIPKARKRVQVIQDGHRKGELCIGPTTYVPDGDVVLMHKLMIEGNEGEYLRTANFIKAKA